MSSQIRFTVYKNPLGLVGIKDREKLAAKTGNGVVALFFQDKDNPDRAEIIAGICAKVLNDEAARRAQKAQP